MTRRSAFIVAFAAGIGLAILGLVGGLIVMGAVLFAAVLTAVNYGGAAFSGLSISVGTTWGVVFLLAAANCAGPDQPCGATPVDLRPHVALSLGLVAVGVAAGLLSRRRRAREVVRG